MTTVADQPTIGTDEAEVERLAKRVDEAMNALTELDPAARAVAEEVKASVEAIHRAALVSIVRRLKSDDATRNALYDLVDDPVVRLLLSLHQIVRADPMTAAQRVLAEVRPQLRSHGGDVVLVRVENGTAFVRLHGACNGCSMASVTLRELVENALVRGIPGVTAVEVLPAEPSPTLIPLDAVRIGRDRTGDGWVRAAATDELADGRLVCAALSAPSGETVEVLVVNLGQRLSAYRNACAHQGLPLDNAVLDVANGTLTCPWHGFCYDGSSGECLTAPGAQLEQLPLRVDEGYVWVRVVS
jgi:Fe-S cluster biogenesis protein NfuA/nitrite reductase/ring-hydroxylating ferredoxin subunit